MHRFSIMERADAYTFCVLQSQQSSIFSSVQLISHVWLFARQWTVAYQASLSITNSWSLLKLMSIKSVKPSNHLIFCWTLLLPPSVFLYIRAFPKYQLCSLDVQSIEASASASVLSMIFNRIDCFFLLEVDRTLKRFLQHQRSKASILWRSNCPMVPLSHPHMTTGKIIVLTIWACIYLCEILNCFFSYALHVCHS